MKQDAQLALAVQLPDDETFTSFVGETNQSSVTLLQQFISRAQRQSTNSFYLFGIKGVGKSHLLHAASHFADQLGKTSVCLSFSELTDLSIEVLDGLEHIEIICLDDIQIIAGDKQWQQAVFDLFNRVLEQDKLIILSGDQSVNELGLTLPDLNSRLTWGLTEQIKPLSDEEKMQALQHRASQRGITIAEDALKYLLNHYSRDMTLLIGYLDTLDKLSIREQRKITIPFIKEALVNNS